MGNLMFDTIKVFKTFFEIKAKFFILPLITTKHSSAKPLIIEITWSGKRSLDSIALLLSSAYL